MNTIQHVHSHWAEVRTSIWDFFHFVQKHQGRLPNGYETGGGRGDTGVSEHFVLRISYCREIGSLGGGTTIT